LADNGSEFEADFARTLGQHGIGRWYTHPKTPKMNALGRASTAPSGSPSSTTTRSCSSRILPSSTQNSPTGSASQTPNVLATASASNPRYPSPSNINPSAKGTGFIHPLDMQGTLFIIYL
jgi:hypothetical protein